MQWQIIILFFIIAIIYSSVGFGGGSSYLAILSLYSIPFTEMRFTALICNVIVVTGGTIAFARHKQIIWEKIIPLLIASVPLAFIGAKIKLHENIYFIILGVSLIVASILLWKNPTVVKQEKNINRVKQAATGGFLGLLSGMVGIGGGIFLSPLLNLSGWGTSKQIAACASIFILVNSLAGLAGQLSVDTEINFQLLCLAGISVFIGGQIGSNLGIVKFNLNTVRRITAIVIFVAGIEVLIKHLK